MKIKEFPNGTASIDIRKTKDGKHDHLEIWCDGQFVCYMHVDKVGIYIWTFDGTHGNHCPLEYVTINGGEAYRA